MELQLAVRTQFSHSPPTTTASFWRNKPINPMISSSRLQLFCPPPLSLSLFSSPCLVARLRESGLRASKVDELLKFRDGNEDDDDDDEGSESDRDDEMEGDDSFVMDEEERLEWRRKIREVMDMRPEVEEEVDPVEKRRKMEKLLADYPLIVDEEDPNWPEDADGRGFKLDQFFNKISIKNVKKDKDDEGYDSENDIVWQDDDYIRPIKDLTTAEWEEAVFKDFSPLIVLVHNRYRRLYKKDKNQVKFVTLFHGAGGTCNTLDPEPKENEKIRDELEKAIQIIWNCRIPSPRCVAVDAIVEHDLVSSLKVSLFPELIFTKSGKILYREKALRTADELSKIMAFFYYGAAKPSFLNVTGNGEETIPTVQISNKQG